MSRTKSQSHLPETPSRILVVDDDSELLALLVEFFQFKGYTCDSALDGNTAYSRLQMVEYDLLVTDISMPGMSGIELVSLAKQRCPALPMIILSGDEEFKTAVDAIDVDVFYFFTKPIRDLEVLFKTACEALKRSRNDKENADNIGRQTELANKVVNVPSERNESPLCNEKYCRTLLENGNDSILIIGNEGKIVDLNQNAACQFGLTRSELLGKYIDSEFFKPALRLFFHQIREVARQGTEVRFESELQRPDGSTHQVEVFSISTFNPEMPEQIVYIRDISDFHRRLQTLKTRNEQLLATLVNRSETVRLNSGALNNFLDTANAFVFIVDLDANILEWNPAAATISGFSRSRALHPGIIRDIFSNFDNQVFPILEKEVFAGGNSLENVEFDINSLDGFTKTLKWNISPIKEIGKICGALLVGVDVTSEYKLRKELEGYTSQLEETVSDRTRELLQSQERFRHLFDSVPDAIFVAGPNGNLLEVNPAWLQLLGYKSKNDVQNKHFLYDFVIDPKQASALVDLLDSKRYVQDHLLQLQRRDGTEVTTLVTITSQPTQGSESSAYEGIIRDVTRLHQLEQKLVDHSQNLEEMIKVRSAELAESEAKFRRLIENSPDIIYRVDIRRMKYDYISPAAEAITGYSVEKLKQFGPDGFVSRIHSKEAPPLIDLWALLGSNSPENPEPFYLEYRFIRADGEIIWLSDRGSAIRSPNGELIAVEGVMHDITSLKNASVNLEEHANLLEQEVSRRTVALAESEYRYRMLLGEAGDIIFTCNLEGKIQEINRRGEDLLGRSLTELNALGFGALLEESSRRRYNKALMSCFKAGIKPEPFQIEYQNPRGSNFLLEIQSSPLIIDDRVVLTMMVARNLTSRRRAAQAIRTLKEFNEGIIRSMSEGIFIENDEGVSEFVNPAMAEMLGYKVNEIEGRHYFDFVSPSDRDLVSYEREMCRLRGFSRYEIKLVGQSGEEIPVYISSRSRLNDGRVVGSLSVVTDLRHTKEMEGRQRLMERLLADERKLADIGMLAAGIAHNISSPLMVISGYTQLLKTKLTKMKEFDVILGQIDKISEITRNMMIKSRSEQDKGIKPIDINGLLQTELKFLEANLHFKSKVEKQYNLDPNIPKFIGIYSDFSQAFSNIINNAIDAMFNSPVKRLAVTTKWTPTEIRISISDSGGGISKENLNRIFDPFFTTKPPVGDVKEGEPTGTGLGLSTSQQLIANYGGKIFVESEPDIGTTFTITLPIVTGQSVGSFSPQSAPKPAQLTQLEAIN